MWKKDDICLVWLWPCFPLTRADIGSWLVQAFSGLFRGPSTAELFNLWISDMDHVFHPPLSWPWTYDYIHPAFSHCDLLISPGEILGQGLRQLLTGFCYCITQSVNKKHTTYKNIETYLMGMYQLPKLWISFCSRLPQSASGPLDFSDELSSRSATGFLNLLETCIRLANGLTEFHIMVLRWGANLLCVVLSYGRWDS